MVDFAAGRAAVDVAVIGGGPAGIAAATRAAESGLSVALLDEGVRPGGQIWRHTARSSLPALARRWLERLARSGAGVISGAAVVDVAPEHEVIAETGGEVLRIRAGQLVLATGARERFLPFPGWTLPNVVGVGGAQALLKSGMSFRARRVVVAGSGPLLLPVAAALAHAGARVRLVAEQAPGAALVRFGAGLWRRPARLAQAVRYRTGFAGARYRAGTWVARAEGSDVVARAVLTDGRRTWTEQCDLLCVGYGLVPAIELARLLGCALSGPAVQVDERQRTSVPGIWCAGEPTGIGGVEAALVEGEIAGLGAAGRPAQHLHAQRTAHREFGAALERAFALRPQLRALATADTLVCRCEDVPLHALAGMTDLRQAKLYTRAGMGPCQGRVCGAALEFLFGWDADRVRTPLSPARLSTFLGPTTAAGTAAGDA